MHSHRNRRAGRPPPLAKPRFAGHCWPALRLQRWAGMLHRAACLQCIQWAFLVFVDGLSAAVGMVPGVRSGGRVHSR